MILCKRLEHFLSGQFMCTTVHMSERERKRAHVSGHSHFQQNGRRSSTYQLHLNSTKSGNDLRAHAYDRVLTTHVCRSHKSSTDASVLHYPETRVNDAPTGRQSLTMLHALYNKPRRDLELQLTCTDACVHSCIPIIPGANRARFH